MQFNKNLTLEELITLWKAYYTLYIHKAIEYTEILEWDKVILRLKGAGLYVTTGYICQKWEMN